MRLLDNYINKSIFKVFLTTVFIFFFMYLLIDVTSQLDEFIDRKVPFSILVQYYVSFFPVIIVQTSSIACLISVLLTFSSLGHNNEILAMRSTGLNFWQITKPALLFALLISCVVFYLNERYVPEAIQTTNQIRNNHMVLEVDRMLKKKEKIKNLTLYGLKNRLYFIDTLDPQNNELHGITIIEHDESQNVTQKIVALKGVWTGIAWKFSKCQVTTLDPRDITSPIKIKIYDEKLMDIKEAPQDFLTQRLNVSSMNLRELKNYIHRFANSGATKALENFRVDFHHKIAYPLENFVIVLIGLPFVMMLKSRKGTTITSIGLGLLIGFFYHILDALSLAFGKGGLFPPIVAAWATPLLFVAIALIIIERNF